MKEEVKFEDESSWKEEIELIANFNKQNIKMLKIRDKIKDLCEYNKLYDMIESNENIGSIFRGGIDENERYRPRSLAKMFKDVLGICPIPEWTNLYRLNGNEAYKDIKCNFINTYHIQYFKVFKDITNKLLSSLYTDKPVINDEEIICVIEDPKKIIEEIKNLYDSMIKISSYCNYYTFFILNTRSVPIYFMESQYSNFKERIDKIKDFLGIEAVFYPNVKEELKNKYTLLGHKKDGIADLIWHLNDNIRKYTSARDINSYYFKDIIFDYIFSNPLLKNQSAKDIMSNNNFLEESYRNKVKPSFNSLRRGSMIAEHEIQKNNINSSSEYLYDISGPIIKYAFIFENGIHQRRELNRDILFFNLLEEISPELFFGFYTIDIDSLKDNKLKILNLQYR